MCLTRLCVLCLLWKKERHDICLTLVIHVVQCLLICMLFVCLLQHKRAGADRSLPTLHRHGAMIWHVGLIFLTVTVNAQPEAAEEERKKKEK